MSHHALQHALVIPLHDDGFVSTMLAHPDATLAPLGPTAAERAERLRVEVATIHARIAELDLADTDRRRSEAEGLRDDAEAFQIAKAVADSALVKTAIFGGDPNWGRVVSAAGYADTLPVAGNDKDDGRKQNRRIEIVVVPNIEDLPPMDDSAKS